MKAIIGEETLVFSAPINENTKKWGVYSIPRMWRDIGGNLVIRLNGETDCGDTDNMDVAPNLFFTSYDNGKSWSNDPEGEKNYPINVLCGIGSPFTKIGSHYVAFRESPDRADIKNIKAQKEFLVPNGEAIVCSYRYGDIPDDCKGVQRLLYDGSGKLLQVSDVDFDFSKREILINSKGYNFKEYVKVRQRVKQSIFKNNYFCAVTPLADGTLVAIACGQDPSVSDHYCGCAYLLESFDMGLSWKMRSIIAQDSNMPYGFTGDGNEVSLCRTKSGALICAMRMEMSIHPDIEKPICDTFIAISHDDGHSWCKPFSISDSSVTPQAVSFENGAVAVVYGRPGVHFKYSTDDGKSWSGSNSIIGKSLSEYRKEGISDADSKYFDSCSYSNVFVEKISENSMLVLYNNAKYDEGDGKHHKAAFVRTVTFEE